MTMTRPAKDRVADASSATARIDSRAVQTADAADTKSAHLLNSLPNRRGIAYWSACAITLLLVTIAVLRIVFHDGTHLLTWLNAFTRYVYLPAYVCLAWTAWKRHWFLAFINLTVICLHLVWLAPDYMRDRRFDSVGSGIATAAVEATSVRIFFANVNGANTEYQALLDEIRDANPDVIELVEFSPNWQRAFLRSPTIAAYPYGGGRRHASMETVSVFSKLPLKSEKRDWVVGREIETVTVPVGSKTLRVVGLHSPRPMDSHGGDGVDDYDAFWNYTIPMLRTDKGPLVVVGDCNATQYSLVYKRITADRLRSAHEDRGRGYATTWPNGYYPFPPIRIDQAFLSPEVECLSIREGTGHGSDHKPLILDVRIRGEE
ncbi:MAG TPA: endonuclease/exonuclease/phosphatase family protein [Lacipirellulaceae bacterium]|nr:endonuclease/exonuclease/phosphatase family protein [Lacipirellulaceae bacterium]